MTDRHRIRRAELGIHLFSRRALVVSSALVAFVLVALLGTVPSGSLIDLFGEIATPVSFEIAVVVTLAAGTLLAALLPLALRREGLLASEWIRARGVGPVELYRGTETAHLAYLGGMVAVSLPFLAAGARLSGLGWESTAHAVLVLALVFAMARELSLLVCAIWEKRVFLPYLALFPPLAGWLIFSRGEANPVYLVFARADSVLLSTPSETPDSVVLAVVAAIAALASAARLVVYYLDLSPDRRKALPWRRGGRQ